MPYTVFIGLGNPKPSYAAQRHNYGVMALDALAQAFNAAPARSRYNSLLQEATYNGARLFFMAPQTYMNLSGSAATQLVSFYKIPLHKVIVLHDELDLPLGSVRIKTGGGHAGHNGLKSLDAHIGNGYVRVRLGIGRGNGAEVVGHVLTNFAPTEKPVVNAVLQHIEQLHTQLLQPTPALAAQLCAAP